MAANEKHAIRRAIWAGIAEHLKRHKTLAYFGTASTLCSVVVMLSGIVVLWWVNPEEMGVWQSLLLIQAYTSWLQFGTLNGLNRELPYTMGRGDCASLQELAGTAQTVTLAGCAILVVAAGVSVVILKTPMLRFGAAIVLLCNSADTYRSYLSVTYRAEKGFQALAHIKIAESSISVASLPFVYFFHFGGLVARFVLTTFLGVSLNHIYRPIRAPLLFSWRSLRLLVTVGIPIFVFGYVIALANTFPRVILLSTGDMRRVGLFAPAYSVTTLCQVIPLALGQYIYPQMSFALGRTGDPKAVWSIAWKTAAGILLLSIPVVAFAEITIPWFVTSYLPKYAGATGAIRWGIVAGMFMGMLISVNALNSLKAWRWMAAYTGFYAVSNLVVPYLLFRTLADPVEGVAEGFAIAQSLSFLVAMYCIFRATHAVPVTDIAPAESGSLTDDVVS
ncbi:MAG: lipopolysaccharide biosynthesis protein [Planctomycetaceae bacterium]|nr:lipopolysaccharide biosynthesis protein [Planctomycetaceae bacterium]